MENSETVDDADARVTEVRLGSENEGCFVENVAGTCCCSIIAGAYCYIMIVAAMAATKKPSTTEVT